MASSRLSSLGGRLFNEILSKLSGVSSHGELFVSVFVGYSSVTWVGPKDKGSTSKKGSSCCARQGASSCVKRDAEPRRKARKRELFDAHGLIYGSSLEASSAGGASTNGLISISSCCFRANFVSLGSIVWRLNCFGYGLVTIFFR